MKKRKIIIPIVAVVLIACLTVSLVLYGNRKESKMAVFESKEQLAEWLVAGDYGAAPSRFHSKLGSFPDLEADVSYLVPLIKEFGIPTIVCDEADFSYTGGYITLSPYAKESDLYREPQIIFHLKLNGYKYTVHATYIYDGMRDLIDNYDKLEPDKLKSEGFENWKEFNAENVLKNRLRNWFQFHIPKEIEVGGETKIFYEYPEYKTVLKTYVTGEEKECLTWGFISGNVVYRIVFDPGENREKYDAMTAEIPKLKPLIISYEEFVEGEVG